MADLLGIVCSKVALIQSLRLEPQVKGGYFRRAFEAAHRDRIDTPHGARLTATAIYYMLTDDQPIGRWHVNRSDIVHFFHLGAPLTYHLIHPDAKYECVVLGPNPMLGHKLQFVVPGDVWKATHLNEDDAQYALVGEAVAPGFEYEDMRIAKIDELCSKFPQHSELIGIFAPFTNSKKAVKMATVRALQEKCKEMQRSFT